MRRASPMSPAMPSASCPRTMPIWRRRWPASVGLGGDADVIAKLSQEPRHHDADASRGGGLLPSSPAAAMWRRWPTPRLPSASPPTGSSSTCSAELPETLTAGAAARAAAPPAAAPLLGGVERQGACRARRICSSSAVRWQSHGRERKGVTSTWLADRRKVGDRVGVYVKRNRHFRLPKDPATPDHHDRRGHGRGALSRASSRSAPRPASRRRAGCSSARATTPTTSCTSSNGRSTCRAARSGASTWRSRATSPRRSTCRIGCGSSATRSAAGSRTARISTCAATRRAWAATWMPRSRASWRSPRTEPIEAGKAQLGRAAARRPLPARRVLMPVRLLPLPAAGRGSG